MLDLPGLIPCEQGDAERARFLAASTHARYVETTAAEYLSIYHPSGGFPAHDAVLAQQAMLRAHLDSPSYRHIMRALGAGLDTAWASPAFEERVPDPALRRAAEEVLAAAMAQSIERELLAWLLRATPPRMHADRVRSRLAAVGLAGGEAAAAAWHRARSRPELVELAVLKSETIAFSWLEEGRPVPLPPDRYGRGVVLTPHGHVCFACGTMRVGGMRRCGRCLQAWYCDAACQLAHWREGGHRSECRLPPSPPAV